MKIQKPAARKNIKKAQQKWKSMSPRQRALAQPQGRARAKPGTTGKGKYYRVVVRPKEQFTTFRMQDVGEKGHELRLAGKRPSGSWDTQAWLISKEDAHVEGDKLIADNPKAKKILDTLPGPKTKVKGDIFESKPMRNVPEREKPKHAQQKARHENLQKAQEARWSKTK